MVALIFVLGGAATKSSRFWVTADVEVTGFAAAES